LMVIIAELVLLLLTMVTARNKFSMIRFYDGWQCNELTATATVYYHTEGA
jgi:hypothetical protein